MFLSNELQLLKFLFTKVFVLRLLKVQYIIIFWSKKRKLLSLRICDQGLSRKKFDTFQQKRDKFFLGPTFLGQML
jgi:hypothetical protein